jgi:hypothetical protein
MGVFSSTGRRRPIRPALAASAVLCLAGAIALTVGVGRSAADSATSVTPSSGTSATTPIMIAIPGGVTCSGDDTGGKNQYQIFPYIIPASESPQSVRYTGGAIQTLAWFTDAAGDNTFSQYPPGVGSHTVSQPANLNWSPYQTNSDYGVVGGLQPGTYNVGEMCIDISSTNNPSGAPDVPGNGDATQDGHVNFWNTQFTFTTSGSTSVGPDFTWTADTNAGSSTTTTTTTTKPSTTTTLARQSTTTVAGGATTTTPSSQAGTTTTLVAGGTGSSGDSGSAGAAGSGSSGSGDASAGGGSTDSAGDAPSSQLAATGASDLPGQVLLGASLAFGGLFILSFAYPTRRPRSTVGRSG